MTASLREKDARPWLDHYDPGVPHRLEPYPDATLLDVVADTARRRSDHTALIFEGARMSHAELDRLSDAFAAALAALGVARGDRVALLLPNSPQAIFAQLGAWKAGAIVAPINPLYRGRELERMLNEIEAETVLVLTPFYAGLKSIQPRTKVRRVIASSIKEHLPAHLRILFTLARERRGGHKVALQAGDLWLRDLLRAHAADRRPEVTVKGSDPALLLFTGGTSGTPKAAIGAHRSLLMSAMQCRAWASSILSDWTDGLTLVMPLFHAYGNIGVLGTALVGRYPLAVVPDPRDIDDLLHVLRTVRPAGLHGVPTLFKALLRHRDVEARKADLSSLKICIAGAAPLLAEDKARFEAVTGVRVIDAYSLTESMLAAIITPARGLYKPGAVGIPLPDVDARIVDLDAGEITLPKGELGEIVLRGPQSMEGYWNRPAETKAVLHDGWVHTGDIGYMDEDGYVFVVDRKKDVIKPGGFQVWPREVEEVLAAHPAVAEVGVAGVPDDHQGEAVKAWVVLHEGTHATAGELRAHCRERLAAYKVPRHIELRTTLPRTLIGKVLRRRLRGDAAGEDDT